MAMCAGVQKLSRPMERCHEISQCAPTIAEVTARTEHQIYHGTVVERVRGRGGAVRVEDISISMVNLSANQERVGNPLQDGILPHTLFWKHAGGVSTDGRGAGLGSGALAVRRSEEPGADRANT